MLAIDHFCLLKDMLTTLSYTQSINQMSTAGTVYRQIVWTFNKQDCPQLKYWRLKTNTLVPDVAAVYQSPPLFICNTTATLGFSRFFLSIFVFIK